MSKFSSFIASALLLGLLILTAHANARDMPYQGDLDEQYSLISIQEMQALMRRYVTYLGTKAPVTVFDAQNGRMASQTESRACTAFYENLFGNDETTEMRIFFGYKGYVEAPRVCTRNAAGKQSCRPGQAEIWTQDIHMKIALQDFLLRPCPANAASRNFYACGFTRVSGCTDPDTRERTVCRNYIEKSFRDLRGNTQNIRIGFTQSSLWLSEAKDKPYQIPADGWRNPGMSLQEITPEQKSYSEAVTEEFYRSLKVADIVFYNGHSTRGSGPNFFPPKIARAPSREGAQRINDLHTNYKWYTGEPEGRDSYSSVYPELINVKRRMYSEVERASNLKLFGMFACNSKNQYFDTLRSRSDDRTSFLMNHPRVNATHSFSYWIDEPVTLLGSINALVGQFCPTSFNELTFMDGSMDPRSAMKLYHSFR